MEWPSTSQRHDYIRALVDSGVDILTIKHHEIAEMFGCSESIVKADITNYVSNRGQILIYALCDPDTDEVRYVGQTAWKLETRVATHMRDSLNGRGNVAKRKWLKSLRANHKWPLAKILERCQPDEADERERWWIEYYRSASLVNVIFNWFELSIGDKLFVARSDRAGNGVEGELWTITGIDRQHVYIASDNGDSVRLVR